MTDRLRDDFEALRASIRARPSGLQATTFAGRIVDMGGMPAAAGRFVAVQPLAVGGDEVEGGAASLVESGDPIVAAWLGSSAPVVGTAVVVESVANRWAAHRARPAPTCIQTDDFCCIPATYLSLTYVNGQTGGGAFGLAWDGATTWRGASGALDATLTAAGAHGVLRIDATYSGYVPGVGFVPPTTESYSTDPAAGESPLVVASVTCDPWLIMIRPAASSNLYKLGYIQFVLAR